MNGTFAVILWRTKRQSTYLFTVLLGNQTSQRRCRETYYDKALPRPLLSTSILVSVSDFKQNLALCIASKSSFLVAETEAHPYTEEAFCISRRNDENTLHIKFRTANMTVPIMSDREE